MNLDADSPLPAAWQEHLRTQTSEAQASWSAPLCVFPDLCAVPLASRGWGRHGQGGGQRVICPGAAFCSLRFDPSSLTFHALRPMRPFPWPHPLSSLVAAVGTPQATDLPGPGASEPRGLRASH